MSTWVVFVIVLFLIVSILGYRRVNVQRKVHAECLEGGQTVQGYDEANHRPEFRLMRRRIVDKLKDHSPEGVLVDVGCGPGYLVDVIAKSLPHLRIVGVDIAEEMLQIATERLSSLGFKEQVEFRQGDAHQLPFQDNTVDFVVSTLSLHHWRNAQEALDEIYRVLRAGGQFILFDFRRDGRKLFYWIFRLAQAFTVPASLRCINEPTVSVFSSYTPVELEAFLSATAFQEWKVKPGFGWLFAWGRKR